MQDPDLTTNGLYDPIECAIVHDALGLPRPAALAGIDPEASREPRDEAPPAGPVRLRASGDGFDYGPERRLCNAVARLALNAIADRLPQWAAVHAAGSVQLARQAQPRRRPPVELLPRFLLMINWADSGPGYSWPEAYHATYLPGFDRYVVTLSADSPECYGYEDVMIGHFAATEDFDAAIERVICGWWLESTRGEAELAWAYLFEEGQVDAATAHAWRAAVWPALYEEDEDEDDDADPEDTTDAGRPAQEQAP